MKGPFSRWVRAWFVVGASICSAQYAEAAVTHWDAKDGVVLAIDTTDGHSIAGWTRTQVTQGWRFTRRIDRSTAAEGRSYPGVVNTGNAVVVDIRAFQFPGASEQDWCAQVAAKSPFAGCAIRAGFLVLTRSPLSDRRPIFSGPEFDAAFSKRVRAAVSGAANFYAMRMGGNRDYFVVLYALPGGSASDCDSVGGTLPGLLLLGISRGCAAPGPLSSAMDHFFAHETFHLWNHPLAPLAAKDPVAMMFLEGGANFAADLRENAARGRRAFRDRVSDAIYECTNYDTGSRPALAMQIAAEPRIAYSCGTALMFGLSGGRAGRYFAMMRSVIAENVGTDLAMRLHDVVTRPDTVLLWEGFQEAGQWLGDFQKVIAIAGYRLDTESEPSGSQALGVAVDVIKDVLRNDCHGSYGLYTDAHPRIDPALRGCEQVRPGLHPQALAGFDLFSASMSARKAWLEACRTGKAVRMTYAEGLGSEVKCAQAQLTAVPVVQLVGPT
jgi:hypothetical protein